MRGKLGRGEVKGGKGEGFNSRGGGGGLVTATVVV